MLRIWGIALVNESPELIVGGNLVGLAQDAGKVFCPTKNAIVNRSGSERTSNQEYFVSLSTLEWLLVGPTIL